MQLTQFTDYAIRTLIYITLKDNAICTIAEIAESFHISKHHLVKVVHKLGQLDILETIRGNQGGIRLRYSPEQINLGELVKKTEPNFFIVECFDKQANRCAIAPACRLKCILHEAGKSFLDTLSQYTIADVTRNGVELNRLLEKGKG